MEELQHDIDDLRVLSESCKIPAFRTLLLSWIDKAIKIPERSEELKRQVRINLKLLGIIQTL